MPSGSAIHPDDDMAHNIMNQRQAEAAPSHSEVKKRHRKELATQGCVVCDETNPDVLNRLRLSTSAHQCVKQQPPERSYDTVVMCDEHERPASVLIRARLIQTARNQRADYAITYDCGHVEFADSDPVPDDAHPMLRDDALHTPEVPVTHQFPRCGATLDEVIPVDSPGATEAPDNA